MSEYGCSGTIRTVLVVERSIRQRLHSDFAHKSVGSPGQLRKTGIPLGTLQYCTDTPTGEITGTIGRTWVEPSPGRTHPQGKSPVFPHNLSRGG